MSENGTQVGACIVGMGCQSSVGLHPAAVAAAARAGLDRFSESKGPFRRSNGSPIMTALLETLDPSLGAFERMRALAAAAADQALAPFLAKHERSEKVSLALFLSVPPARPGFGAGEPQRLAKEVAEALPLPIDRQHAGLFDTGQEGGIAALAHATDLVSHGEVELCLVGGVESYWDAEALRWLEQTGRLKSEGNPYGMVPGEGAAFVLVASRSSARRLGLKIQGRVRKPARSTEPHPWYTEQPCFAQGLTEAISGALETLPKGLSANTAWSDLNGEMWRADEWDKACARTADRAGGPLRLRRPAEVYGDVGSATGTMLVILAALDLKHPRAMGDRALVFAGSDTLPYRSACIVERTSEK